MALTAVLGLTGTGVGLLRYRLEGLAASLAAQANTDPVTSIANRRSFESHFDEELRSADDEGSRLSVVICDLDRFKLVNDELGHEEGDKALRLAAETIASSVRSIDIVFRLGGEEFAVLLPNTGSSEAYTVAERIRGGIQDAFASYPVPVTVSCGLATRVHRTMNRKALLRAADSALYHAKRDGRNRTMTHDPEFEGSERRSEAGEVVE
jgi:diguanylate cyclase (GGDEF)-like protein